MPTLVWDEDEVLRLLRPLDERVQIQFPRFCVLRLRPAIAIAKTWTDVGSIAAAVDACMKVVGEFTLTGQRPSRSAINRLLESSSLAAAEVPEEIGDGVLIANALLACVEMAHHACALLNEWSIRNLIFATRPLLDIHAAVAEQLLYGGGEGFVITTTHLDAVSSVEEMPVFSEMLTARERCVMSLVTARGPEEAEHYVDALVEELPTDLWKLIEPVS